MNYLSLASKGAFFVITLGVGESVVMDITQQQQSFRIAATDTIFTGKYQSGSPTQPKNKTGGDRLLEITNKDVTVCQLQRNLALLGLSAVLWNSTYMSIGTSLSYQSSKVLVTYNITSSPKGMGCPSSQLATTRLLPMGGSGGLKQATWTFGSKSRDCDFVKEVIPNHKQATEESSTMFCSTGKLCSTTGNVPRSLIRNAGQHHIRIWSYKRYSLTLASCCLP